MDLLRGSSDSHGADDLAGPGLFRCRGRRGVLSGRCGRTAGLAASRGRGRRASAGPRPDDLPLADPHWCDDRGRDRLFRRRRVSARDDLSARGRRGDRPTGLEERPHQPAGRRPQPAVAAGLSARQCRLVDRSVRAFAACRFRPQPRRVDPSSEPCLAHHGRGRSRRLAGDVGRWPDLLVGFASLPGDEPADRDHRSRVDHGAPTDHVRRPGVLRHGRADRRRRPAETRQGNGRTAEVQSGTICAAGATRENSRGGIRT